MNSKNENTNTKIAIRFRRACLYNEYEIIDELIKQGACINYHAEYCGLTPLILAAKENNYLVVKKLLTYDGIDINYMTRMNSTALWLATRNSCYKIIKLLLEKGAKIYNDIKYKYDFNDIYNDCLVIAINNENIKIIKLLLLYGAQPFKIIYNGSSAFDYAISNNKMQISEIFKHIKDNYCNSIFETAISIITSPFEYKKLLKKNIINTDMYYKNKSNINLIISKHTSQKMRQIIKLSLKQWSPSTHFLYSDLFQNTIFTILIIIKRLNYKYDNKQLKNKENIIYLPNEIWCKIIRFLPRA